MEGDSKDIKEVVSLLDKMTQEMAHKNEIVRNIRKGRLFYLEFPIVADEGDRKENQMSLSNRR